MAITRCEISIFGLYSGSMTAVKIRTRKLQRPPRAHPHVRFLRQLRASGRSNMYGAIPYLMETFGVDRTEAFTIVCEFLDSEAAVRASPSADTADS